MVIAVLDTPVGSDGGADLGGGQGGLTGVEGNLFGLVPEAGFGILVPSQPGDACHRDDEVAPLLVEAARNVEGLDPAMLLAAMAAAIDRLGAVGGRLFGADGGYGVEQTLLVALDLGDQDVSGVSGCLESFF